MLKRGASPRVVRAEVVGSGGRAAVSGPTLRRKLGLYDTWARFTVITPGATRGDGNAPQPPAPPQPPAEPATGGAVPRRRAAGASALAMVGSAGACAPRANGITRA